MARTLDPWPRRRLRGRSGGRRTTRAKLVDATRRVVADKGVEATTIALVTEAADVGFGTFYLHFDSKEAAIEAVMAELVEEVGHARSIMLTAPMQDPAEVLAVSVRHVVGQVDRDEVWAWAVLRIGVSHQLFTSALGGRLVRDLQRGVDARSVRSGDCIPSRRSRSAASSKPRCARGSTGSSTRTRRKPRRNRCCACSA